MSVRIHNTFGGLKNTWTQKYKPGLRLILLLVNTFCRPVKDSWLSKAVRVAFLQREL